MLRAAGATKRHHTAVTIGQQTVAEHSFHVAMLCDRLSEGKPSVNLLKAALFHDLAETVTGDVPAPVKWQNPVLADILKGIEYQFEDKHRLCVELTVREEAILKYADAFELGFYCVDQLMLGNKNMNHIYWNIVDFIDRMRPTFTTSEIEAVREELEGKFNDAIG